MNLYETLNRWLYESLEGLMRTQEFIRVSRKIQKSLEVRKRKISIWSLHDDPEFPRVLTSHQETPEFSKSLKDSLDESRSILDSPKFPGVLRSTLLSLGVSMSL